MDKIRVLIVEDEPIIASNLAMYMDNNDYCVAAIAYDYNEAISELGRKSCDFAILDINLGNDKDGIELANFIHKNYSIPFIFLTSYSDKLTIEKAKKVNPMGFLTKPFNGNTLTATIEIAIENYALLYSKHVPELAMEKINEAINNNLTEREYEALNLIYKGKTNKQITDQLFISINTLKKHINNAYAKMDVENRTAAVMRLREIMMG